MSTPRRTPINSRYLPQSTVRRGKARFYRVLCERLDAAFNDPNVKLLKWEDVRAELFPQEGELV